MVEEIRRIWRKVRPAERFPVRVWCIDRPDAYQQLLSHPELGKLLRPDTTDAAALFDARLEVREWCFGEPAIDGSLPWMSWMPPGVYIEMSDGLPAILKI